MSDEGIALCSIYMKGIFNIECASYLGSPSIIMSLSASLNFTQKDELVAVIYNSTASSDAPLLLLESFIMGILHYHQVLAAADIFFAGVLCACVPLASYLVWYDLLNTNKELSTDRRVTGSSRTLFLAHRFSLPSGSSLRRWSYTGRFHCDNSS